MASATGRNRKERSGIEKDFGVKAIYSGADMSKGAQIAAMIADAEKQLGSVDILVNNAGIQFVFPIEEFPVEKWDQIIAINLSAAFHAIRAAIPGMKRMKGAASSPPPRLMPWSPRLSNPPMSRPSTVSPA